MLKRSFVIAAGFGLCATAAQADNAWTRYGNVPFDDETEREVESADLGGPIDRFRLTARRSGIVCRRVVAVFGNNKRRQIFSGRIRRGRSRTLDLPGNERHVKRLVLVCRATRRGREDHGRLLIEARVEERHGRRHGRQHRGRRGRYDWERLGTVVVEGRFEREVKTTRGYDPMDRLRLSTRHSGVVCRRVIAVFGNGNRRKIYSGRIRRNEREIIDLPGDDRNVKRLIFVCRGTRRGRSHGRLLVDGRFDQRRARHGDATVCCRKLFFEWTTTARQCRRFEGNMRHPRYCR